MLYCMENFILTTAYLVIGMVLKRAPKFPGGTAQVLNLFVIYVSLPALILLKVPELVFSKELLVPVVMPWLMLGFSAGLILALSKITGWERAIVGVLLLLVPLGNTSFLGIPMVQAFFGGEGIPYAVFYDQFGSFLALATYGHGRRYGHRGRAVAGAHRRSGGPWHCGLLCHPAPPLPDSVNFLSRQQLPPIPALSLLSSPQDGIMWGKKIFSS